MKKIILISIITLLLFSSLGCINNKESEDDIIKTNEIPFSYYIELDMNDNDEYFLFCPIIINKDGTLSKLMEQDGIIEGNADYSYESTIYGEVINISGTGDFSIQFSYSEQNNLDFNFNKSRHPENSIDMNLWTSQDQYTNDYDLGNVWIFFNSFTTTSNNPISLLLDLQLGELHHLTKDRIEIIDGWQGVKIIATEVVP